MLSKCGVIMLCVGYKAVNFTAKESGEVIEGYSVSLYEPFTGKEKFEHFGGQVEKIFLSKKKFEEFGLADLAKREKDFTVLYNRYGKIDRIVA